MSGYTTCACRDCFETAISDDMSKPDLCWECKAAGCEPFPPGADPEAREVVVNVNGYDVKSPGFYYDCAVVQPEEG